MGVERDKISLFLGKLVHILCISFNHLTTRPSLTRLDIYLLTIHVYIMLGFSSSLYHSCLKKNPETPIVQTPVAIAVTPPVQCTRRKLCRPSHAPNPALWLVSSFDPIGCNRWYGTNTPLEVYYYPTCNRKSPFSDVNLWRTRLNMIWKFVLGNILLSEKTLMCPNVNSTIYIILRYWGCM